MTPLLLAEIVVKATLLLGCAAMLPGLMRRHGPALKHMLWLVALAGVILLPTIAPFVHGRTVLTLPAESRAEAGSEPATDAGAQIPVTPFRSPSHAQPIRDISGPLPWGQAIQLIWLAGVLVVAARYAHGAVSLWMLRRIGTVALNPSRLCIDPRQLAERAGIHTNWELRIATASDPASAMTWGLRRPVVLLPQGADGWPAERLEAVLLHEFAHVRRHDFASQLLAEIACALYWFNPIAWFGARTMRADAELAADEAVLRSGVKPSVYAAELLQIAAEVGRPRPTLIRAGIPVMSQSNIESRLHSVLSPSARHRGVTTLQALAAVVFAGLTVTGMASLRATALASDDPRPVSEQTEALIRIKQAALATIMYSQDFDDVLPYPQSTAVVKVALAPYAKKQDIFESPTKGGEFRYNLNVGGALLSKVDKPAEVPLWSEHVPPKSNPVVAYVDGHARTVLPDKMKDLAAALAIKHPRPNWSKPFSGGIGK